MASPLGQEAGKRANWSSLYQSDRPQDILGLTQAQEDDFGNIIGFQGRKQDGSAKSAFILVYDETDALTLTDYATTPIGTIIIAPKIAKPTIYIHKAQSSPAVVGDWYEIEGTQVT